jgi:hypothetical protein
MNTSPQTPGGECHLTPNYTASSPAGFTAAAAKMKSEGVHAFPYLEGRVMDTKLPDWSLENVAESGGCGIRWVVPSMWLHQIVPQSLTMFA